MSTDETGFTYSLGRNRIDVRPRQCHAGTLREFAADVLRRRAKDKASAGYVCAGFDGSRKAANALPRRFLALDVVRASTRRRSWTGGCF